MLTRSAVVIVIAATHAIGQDTGLARREFAKAIIAESRGDEEAAIAHREAARVAHSTAINLVQRCATDRIAAGDIRGASTLYRELAGSRPDSLNAQIMYADFLRDSGKEDDFALNLAVKTLEQARSKFPSSTLVWEKLFRIHEQRGHPDKSQALYDAYMQEPDADPAVAESMNRVMHDTDDANARQQVGQLYLQRFESEPENPTLARAASEHFRKQGDKASSIDILRRHVSANPSSLDMRIRLGILYLDDDKAQVGEKELLDVLRIDPEKHVAHQTLAKLYTKQNKPDPARRHRSELLRIRGGDEEEFVTLAQEWLDAKNPNKAIILLEKARFDYKKSIELAWLHAMATHQLPDAKKKAAKLFREAAALAKDSPCKNPEYLSAAAAAFWDDGDKIEAENQLRRAITLYPRDDKKGAPAALRLLASWWQQQGKNVDAAQALIKRAEALEK